MHETCEDQKSATAVSLRRRAQEKIDSRHEGVATESSPTVTSLRPSSSSEASEADRSPEYLIQELSIHQVELEIQNEELRLTAERLEEAKSFQRKLFSFAPTGLLLLNHKEIIIDINQTACDYFAHSDTMLIGQRLASFVPPAHYIPFRSYMDRQQNNAENDSDRKNSERRIELQFRGKAVSDFWVRFEAVALQREDSTHCYLCSFQEIEQEKLAERILLEEKEQLTAQLRDAHKLEAVGTLAGGIAHNFNNMLAVIIGNLQLSLSDNCGSEQRDRLERASIAAFQARDMITQLLTFSRKRDAVILPVALQSPIQDAIKLVKATAPPNVTFRIQLADQPLVILGDRLQLQEMLINMLVNSFQAMTPDGGEVTIQLKHIEPSAVENPDSLSNGAGNYGRIIITDDGPGIPEDKLERVFDPFYSTKSKQKGAGLGLSVVHGLVEHHSGTVRVDNAPGRGARFTIQLPLAAELCSVLSQDESTTTGSARLLLVDDDQIFLNLGKLIIEHLGHQVTTCTSGERALALLKDGSENVDLVITDLAMPGMGGIELMQAMKRACPTTPVALCSSAYGSLVVEDIIEIGFYGVLEKPFILKELASLIKGVLT